MDTQELGRRACAPIFSTGDDLRPVRVNKKRKLCANEEMHPFDRLLNLWSKIRIHVLLLKKALI